jgi:aspartate racemase
MKTIGLVGGMTPESTVAYYRMLIELGRAHTDDPLHNPVVIIYSIDLAKVAAAQSVGEEARVVAHLAAALERLRAAGAELGALTANTPHVYFDRIREATALPLVSIVDATSARVQRLGARRVLLLGTNATTGSPMYPRALGGAGIEVVVPSDDDRAFVNRTIYEELAVGAVTPELHAAYLDICRRHVEGDNVDAVLLACTEIPLVLADGDLPVPLVDTARCHAEALFERARS